MGRRTTRQLASKRGRQKSKKSGLQPGDTLQERYRIVGTLGVGGFSSVYQARDMRFPNVTKLCAIKEMVISAPDPQIRELTIKSFEREASMLAMLSHPAIPDVSDYFTEGDRSYLVLELIRGKDLEAWLEEQTDFLDQETAVNWALQLCEALAHLHTQKPTPIVFRDLKPSNIMLDQYEHIRLIDFGIAKNFDSGNKGTMIGTEGYSPPEQYRGHATPAGDIYAFGATLHHLLTQQDPRLEPPFTFKERPISKVNPQVTPAFEAIIMRCLDYDPKKRYHDAVALKEALQILSQPGPQSAAEATATAATGDNAYVPAQERSTGATGETAAPGTAAAQTVKPIWVFKCEDEIRNRVAVAQGLVFVGVYDNNLYAITADTGEFNWKFPTSDGVGAAPCVYDETVFIGSADNFLYSLQLRSGRQNWRYETKGPIYSSPAVKYDHVFFGSDDGYMFAVNAGSGREAWKANAYSAVRSSPFVDEDRVYFGTEGSYIFALELTTGKVVWQSSHPKRAVTSSPYVVDDIVFVGSQDSTIYALDASSGWPIWRVRTRRPIISSPIVHKDNVYIGSSDGNLYALDMMTGRQRWVFETEGQIASSPAVWDDAVYFGSTDGNVYCLSLKRGEVRWQFETQGAVIAPPAIADGVVYIGSADHNLYALPV